MPVTLHDAAIVLGHPLAVPAEYAGVPPRIETRTSLDQEPTAGGWADAITCYFADSGLIATTERCDCRSVTLCDIANEGLFKTWQFDPAVHADIEQWLTDRTRDAYSNDNEERPYTGTVDGHDYHGIYRRHDDHAAWAVDTGDVRVCLAGPAAIVDGCAVALGPAR
jgi:hypothetical protein